MSPPRSPGACGAHPLERRLHVRDRAGRDVRLALQHVEDDLKQLHGQHDRRREAVG
jgi:hypothetical protein